jgi:hypothetical protein
MSVLSPRFFVLPLAAALIICALPRAEMAPDHALAATQKGVLKLTSTKSAPLQLEKEAVRAMRVAAATDSGAF